MQNEYHLRIFAALNDLESLNQDHENDPKPLLIHAVSNGLHDMVDYLAQADPYFENDEWTLFEALSQACEQKNVAMVSILLKYGADPSFSDEDGMFILDRLVTGDMQGCLEYESKEIVTENEEMIIELLLEHGASLSEASSSSLKDKLLNFDSKKYFPNDFKIFMSNGSSDKVDEFITKYFCFSEQDFSVSPLIRNTEVFMRDDLGNTPAHYLVKSSLIFDHPEVVERALFYLFAIARVPDAWSRDVYPILARVSDDEEDADVCKYFFDGDNVVLTVRNKSDQNVEDSAHESDWQNEIFGSGTEGAVVVLARAKRLEEKFIALGREHNFISSVNRERRELASVSFLDKEKPKQKRARL